MQDVNCYQYPSNYKEYANISFMSNDRKNKALAQEDHATLYK